MSPPQVLRPVPVELLEGFLGAERSATQAGGELPLLTAGDLILDEQSEEVGIRELQINRFTVAGLNGIEDAREAYWRPCAVINMASYSCRPMYRPGPLPMSKRSSALLPHPTPRDSLPT